MRASRLSLLLSVSWAALLGGCVDIDLNGTTCRTKADCPSGFECVELHCWQPGQEPTHAGALVDAGAGDAGTGDAGVGDAGVGDAGAGDAGVGDAGATDGGAPDAGVPDAGKVDGGAADAGPQSCPAPCGGGTVCNQSVCTAPSACASGCGDLASGICLGAESLAKHDACGVAGATCLKCPVNQTCFNGGCMDLACGRLTSFNPTTVDPAVTKATAYVIDTRNQDMGALSTGDLTADGLDEVAFVHGGTNLRVLLNTDGGLSDCLTLGPNELGLPMNPAPPPVITRTLLLRTTSGDPQVIYVAGNRAYRLSLRSPQAVPVAECGSLTTVTDIALASGGTVLVCASAGEVRTEQASGGAVTTNILTMPTEQVTELSALATPPAAAMRVAYGGTDSTSHLETGVLDLTNGLQQAAAPWVNTWASWEGLAVPGSSPNVFFKGSTDASNTRVLEQCTWGTTAPASVSCSAMPTPFAVLAVQPWAPLPAAAGSTAMTGLAITSAGFVARVSGNYATLTLGVLDPVSPTNTTWTAGAATTGHLSSQTSGEWSTVADALLLAKPLAPTSGSWRLYVLP